MHVRWTAALAAGSMALILGGCGGSLSPAIPGLHGSQAYTMVAEDDTQDSYSGHDGWEGGDEGGTTIQVGTTQSRNDDMVVGFVAVPLPQNVTANAVRSATLRLFVTHMQNNPFQRFLPGGIRVDHILDDEFYLPLPNAVVLHPDIGVLATDGTVGWRELDVTAYVKEDLAAGRTVSRFGLRFLYDDTMADPDGDDAVFNDEYVLFEDAGDNQGTGNRPELVVTVGGGA